MADRVIVTVGTRKGVFVAESAKARRRFVLRGPFGPGVPVYATLIVTFGFQVARVEGQSMAPTLEDQDRLIVNKLVYRLHPPRRGSSL